MQRVDMAAYLSELCNNFAHLQELQDHRIDVVSDADDIILDVDRAINVALIAGEAISNALKHAFPEPRRGAIRIGFQNVGDDLVLTIEDNGIGLPAERRVGAMGMRLIEGMARGLGGTLAIDGDDKTLITVQFPLARNS